jgi:hypothetical protein
MGMGDRGTIVRGRSSFRRLLTFYQLFIHGLILHQVVREDAAIVALAVAEECVAIAVVFVHRFVDNKYPISSIYFSCAHYIID